MNILSIIIIAVAVIIAIVFLIYKIKKEGLRPLTISIIVEAEKLYEKGKNEEKFNYVFNIIYENVPGVLKLLFTKENINKFIQKIFDEIKIALDYNNTNI